ncbi:ciliogenesis and planar polarity effector 2 isoform X2 [Electrophorus electricus]|uniref:ciliogenesis and planar polarity effector 2 isoform X2 n=1 Tax=Electrophorus electricus TaxID=8005 RepID=UPI000F0A8CD1|nr:ciliogenesis and planar polarity effector 2 isoform X2 [Electrophorus electricus]
MPTVPPGSIFVTDWHRSPESREYFNKILYKKKRRKFGLLEAPVMPPNLKADTVRYKVFISGKSGVGKTALAARLTGLEIPNVHYETTGMETSVVFWPVKLRESGRVLFFHFQLWDCGENVMCRFDHMLPSCEEQADAILLLFSFTDHGSFEDISNQMPRLTDPSDRVVRLVVGTNYVHTYYLNSWMMSLTWGPHLLETDICVKIYP